MFLLFDQNDDQTILVQDLGTIMRALGQYPTDSEVKSLIDEIDADGKYRKAPSRLEPSIFSEVIRRTLDIPIK